MTCPAVKLQDVARVGALYTNGPYSKRYRLLLAVAFKYTVTRKHLQFNYINYTTVVYVGAHKPLFCILLGVRNMAKELRAVS